MVENSKRVRLGWSRGVGDTGNKPASAGVQESEISDLRGLAGGKRESEYFPESTSSACMSEVMVDGYPGSGLRKEKRDDMEIIPRFDGLPMTTAIRRMENS